MQALHKIFSGLKAPRASWFGVRYVREETGNYSFRNLSPFSLTSHVTEGVFVEALVNGCFAYAATADLSQAGLSAALERATQLARAASEHRIFTFSATARPASKGRFVSPREKPIADLNFSQLAERMHSLQKCMKVSDKIRNTITDLMTVRVDSHFLSSNGADYEQDLSLVGLDAQCIAQDGNEVQKRSINGFLANCKQAGLEHFFDPNLESRATQCGEEALELLSVENCPNDTRSLILMPDQMMLQIHESIGHPLELDRILGDERNYAGWSFVKTSDFGSLQYGSKLLNVTFDPHHEAQYASYPVDDSGLNASKQYLIKAGVLVRALGGLESQQRSQIAGVANFRASSWNRAPIDRMANINLEAGQSRYEDIIAGTQKGILMHSNRSWSIDDYRRKFQFGCEYAKLVENGKITRTIKNPNYRGTALSFWNSLDAVGDSASLHVHGSPFCGKGEPSQIIRVGHASPVCRFANIEIFGGA